MTTNQNIQIGQRVIVQDGRWIGTVVEVTESWAAVELSGELFEGRKPTVFALSELAAAWVVDDPSA